jgi:hypothetical protein
MGQLADLLEEAGKQAKGARGDVKSSLHCLRDEAQTRGESLLEEAKRQGLALLAIAAREGMGLARDYGVPILQRKPRRRMRWGWGLAALAVVGIGAVLLLDRN